MFSNSIKRFAFSTAFALFLVACGGGDISSTDNSFGSQGATPFAGSWTFNARISVNVAGTTTTISQASTVAVDGNGAAAINTTDTDCSVRLNFNGSQVNYQTTCLVSNGVTNAVPCSLTFTGRASVVGNSASGSINPQTVLCNGVPATFTGNISGLRM